MLHMQRSRLAWAAAAPLLLLAGAVTLPPAGAAADPACSAWNGGQPVNPGNFNLLSGIAVVSTCDVWAVGQHRQGSSDSATLTQHWTGTSWTTVPSPSPGYAALTAVSAVSASDVWTVGATTDGNSPLVFQSLAEHWDGTSWNFVPTPSFSPGATLSAVAARSANDAWAAGWTGRLISSRQALVLHWNGTAWSQAPIPDLGSSTQIVGMSATSATDAWALGTAAGHPFTLHWNGTSWTQVPVPDPGSAQLNGVAATSATDAWAVGSYVTNGVTQNLTEHWNGTSWSQVPSPDPGGSTQPSILSGVAATTSGDVWTVGTYGTNPQTTPFTLHWNGSSWTSAFVDTPGQGAGDSVTAVAAAARGQAWIAGNSDDESRTFAAPLPVVPDLIGKTPASASALLGTYGLVTGSVSHTTTCGGVGQGLVTGQSVAIGQQEPFATAVDLTVCAAAAAVTVPNVLGQDQGSAQNAITAAGLTVGPVTMDNLCKDVAGTVLTQNPGGGSQAQPEAAVSLTVSSGVTSAGKRCVFN